MKQMLAPEAKPERATTLGELLDGFFRRTGDEMGRIFFRYQKIGGELSFSLVLENGRLFKTSGELIDSAETIEVISQAELGIDRVYWA